MEEDFNINEGEPILRDEIKLIFQQLDILYDTYKRDVLGMPEFGTQYDEFLYDTLASADTLKTIVESDINNIELYGWHPVVSVSIHEGTEQDICLINIVLEQYGETYNKTYKIT